MGFYWFGKILKLKWDLKMSDWMKEEEARWERDKHWLMSHKNLAFMERWCKKSREAEEESLKKEKI